MEEVVATLRSMGDFSELAVRRALRVTDNNPEEAAMWLLMHGSEPVEEESEDGDPATCTTPGCDRPTYNGQAGETCCRTCAGSAGAQHGPVCESEWRGAGEGEDEEDDDACVNCGASLPEGAEAIPLLGFFFPIASR